MHQPSRARLQAAHCPAARGSPHRAELGSTGRVTEPNRVRRGRPSPSRSQAWTSIQIWTSIQTDRSAALLSCVLPHPAPDAAVLPPICHAPLHSCIRASSAVECEPFVTRNGTPRPVASARGAAARSRQRRRGSPPPRRPHPSSYPALTGGFMSTRVGRRRCRRVCQRSRRRAYRRSYRRSRRR